MLLRVGAGLTQTAQKPVPSVWHLWMRQRVDGGARRNESLRSVLRNQNSLLVGAAETLH